MDRGVDLTAAAAIQDARSVQPTTHANAAWSVAGRFPGPPRIDAAAQLAADLLHQRGVVSAQHDDLGRWDGLRAR